MASFTRLICTLVAVAGICALASAHAAPLCYRGSSTFDPFKPNKLYLYFPTVSDQSFPAFDLAQPVISPVPRFEIGDLPNSPTGSTSTLRNRIADVVATDYCEFNVQVLQATTNPDSWSSPPERRNTIAVASDVNGGASSVLYGLAEHVDVGDAAPVDHARVWAGSYGAFQDCVNPGGPLADASNIQQRWAYGIGGTAAQVSGHNYGLSHSDGAIVRSGEDALTNHIMPPGPSVPCSARVSQRRHFSDTDYGVLANNVGLTIQTLSNWDLVNPNNVSASAFRLEVLSSAGAIAAAWPYLGFAGPWGPPSVSGPVGTQMFNGVVYNRFFITWSTPELWQSRNQPNSTAGVVRPAEVFRVGVHFGSVDLTPDPVVVNDAVLFDASGKALPIHPRAASYTSDLAADGSFVFTIFNLSAQAAVLRNLRALVLPRQLDIDSMTSETIDQNDFLAVDGTAFTPWRQLSLPTSVDLPGGSAVKAGEASVFIGNLFQAGHNVRIIHGSEPGGARPGSAPGTVEVNPVPPGSLVTDPFPGAAVLLVADVEDPNALQWDPQLKQFVTKALTTRVFFQVAGERAKPVVGVVSGFSTGKAVCTNLSTRATIALTLSPPPGGGPTSFDCEQSGLVSRHGDAVEITEKLVLGNKVPSVRVAGMSVDKVVCTDLSTRESVSFSPSSSLGVIDCGSAGLKFYSGQTVEITQKGRVR